MKNCISKKFLLIAKFSKIYFLIVPVCAILLGGCNARQVGEPQLHIIDFVEAVNHVEEAKLSDCVSSLKYTPIETSKPYTAGLAFVPITLGFE